MPTNRPRHMITETDELGVALDQAAELWPELRGQRGQLLRKVLEVGSAEIKKTSNADHAKRVQQIKAVAGSLTGVWPVGWREELAGDWPT
jgi:hypothetical protein